MKILYCLYVISATFQVFSPRDQNGLSAFYHDLLQISQEIRTYESEDIIYAGLYKEQIASFRNVLRIVSSLCLTQSTPDFNFCYFIDFNLCDLNVKEKEALLSFQLFGDLTKDVMSGRIKHKTLHKEFMIKAKEIIQKIKTSEMLVEKDVFNEIYEKKFTFIHLSWNVLVPSLMCHSKDMSLSYNDYALYINVLNNSTVKDALKKPKDKPFKIISPSKYKLNGLKFIDHKDRYFFKYNFDENVENLKLINIRCSIDIVDSFLRIFNIICKSYQIFLKISITYEDQLFMANIKVDKVSKEPTISNIKIKNEFSLMKRSSSFRSIRKDKNTIRRAKTSIFDYVRKSPVKDSSPGSAKSSADLNSSGSSNMSSPYHLSSNNTSGNLSPLRGSFNSPINSSSPNSSGFVSPVRGFAGDVSFIDEETVSCHNFFRDRSKSSTSLNKSSSKSTISLNRSDSKVKLNSSKDKKDSKTKASPKNDISLIDDISIHSLITLSNIFMSFNKKAVVLSTDNVFVEMLVPKHLKKTDDFEIGRLNDFFNYRFNERDVAKKVKIIENFTKKILKASKNSDLEDFIYFITMADDGKDIQGKISFKEYIKIVGLTKIAIRFLDWYHLPVYEDTLDKVFSALKSKKKDFDKELANLKKLKLTLEKNKIKKDDDEEFPDSIPYIKTDDIYYPFYVYMNLLEKTKFFLNEKRLFEILEETIIYLMCKKSINDKYNFTKTYKYLVSFLSTLFELLSFKIDFTIYLFKENVFPLMPDFNNTFSEKINLVDIIKDFNPINYQQSKVDVYTVSLYSIKKKNVDKHSELPYIAVPANFTPTITIPEKVINDIYDKMIVKWIERLDKFLFESLKN